jgi:hypothetical protein
MCIIIDDTSKEFDTENNPVINLQNLERGANHRAEGETDSAGDKGKGSSHGDRMADNQRSNQPWHIYTTRFNKGSFNGVPICLTPAKEVPATGKKRNKEKA